MSRLDEALASVDKAIEIKADVAKMHEARAALLRDLGRPDEARAADAKAREIAASNQASDQGREASAPPKDAD
jgi:Flp pilus assembly protein TadD